MNEGVGGVLLAWAAPVSCEWAIVPGHGCGINWWEQGNKFKRVMDGSKKKQRVSCLEMCTGTKEQNISSLVSLLFSPQTAQADVPQDELVLFPQLLTLSPLLRIWTKQEGRAGGRWDVCDAQGGVWAPLAASVVAWENKPLVAEWRVDSRKVEQEAGRNPGQGAGCGCK